MERLARKLCEAYGGDPEGITLKLNKTSGDMEKYAQWLNYANRAEHILRERWATFECWRRNPPALYTGHERPAVDTGDYSLSIEDKDMRLDTRGASGALRANPSLAGININDKPAGSGGEGLLSGGRDRCHRAHPRRGA